MQRFLYHISKILDCIPDRFVRWFCILGGCMLYHVFPSRRRIILKNLYTVFPQKSEKWRRKIAKINCCRWVETVWLFITGSSWKQGKILEHFSVSAALKNWIQHFQKNKKSAVVLVPHLNLMETMTWIPCFFDEFPNVGVVYRPFRSKWFETWIRTTRERFGLQLVSRKRGIAPLEKILKNNGIVGVLFDQSAGETGCLTTFSGKLASCTDLPGRLVEKYASEVVAIYLKRTGFLRGELCIEEIHCQKNPLSVMVESNRWLETKLQTESAFFENWLWMHRRWKTQHWPLRRFNISQKRNLLSETCAYLNWDRLPQKTSLWIRMPNWLGDCIMTLPLLWAIRKARPDFCVHLLCQRGFAPWLQRHAPVDFIHMLPKKSGISYFKSFLKLREQYPDIWLNFTNSTRSDLEAFCSGAKQRFGVQKQGWRFLLNYVAKIKPTVGEHQTEFWYRFLQGFGLKEPIARSSICIKTTSDVKSFGCFFGSANTPQKRWPAGHWRELVRRLLEEYPNAHCLLLGSAKDKTLGTQILMGLPTERVKNLAGATSLIQLEEILNSLDLVIANDSGGMHMSNYLGIPTVGIFGPTDPSWGGPFFDGHTCVVKSPTQNLQDLSVEHVFTQITSWIFKP